MQTVPKALHVGFSWQLQQVVGRMAWTWCQSEREIQKDSRPWACTYCASSWWPALLLRRVPVFLCFLDPNSLCRAYSFPTFTKYKTLLLFALVLTNPFDQDRKNPKKSTKKRLQLPQNLVTGSLILLVLLNWEWFCNAWKHFLVVTIRCATDI